MSQSRLDLTHTLTNDELYYLRMIMFGFSREQKINFFNSDESHLSQIKHGIEFKFNTQNWSVIINYVLGGGFIKLTDYKNEVLEKFVLSWVRRKISTWGFDNDVNNFFVLKKELKKLNEDIEFNYKNNYFYTHFQRITEQEFSYISLKYLEVGNEIIASKLKVNVRRLELIRLRLFDKLKQQTWLSVFRCFYQYGYLDKDFTLIEKNFDEIAGKINLILKSNMRTQYKILSIYEEVLIGFISIEFKAILKRNYKHSELSF